MKRKSFKILWHYLKDDKLKVLLYMFLVLLNYLPVLISAYFWGKALELLILKNLFGFFKYLALLSSIYIIFYSILQTPSKRIYNYLEIKFMKQVSHDLYKKIDKLPAIAFEDIGVGEFINRLYTDTDRVMNLLAQLVRLICKSIVVVFVIGLAFYISIVIGIEIMIFAFIMGFISYKFFPKIKNTQKDIKKESDEYVKVATENITGIREIKALGINNNIEKSIFRRLEKLFILFNTKWQKKEILYDETILTYLRKMSSDKRKQLYDIINMPMVENSDFYNDTEEMLKKQLNMQEGVKKLKLERR